MYRQQCDKYDQTPAEEFMNSIFVREFVVRWENTARFMTAIRNVLESLGNFAAPSMVYAPANLDPAAWENVSNEVSTCDAPATFL